MNISKNSSYYILGILLFILLKLGFKYADTQDLIFLIKPTNFLIGIITGSPSRYIENNGYYYHLLDIIIDKSCSGFNFWVLLFLMMLFLCFQHMRTHSQKVISIPLLFLFSFIITILVNTSRIFVAIILQNQLSQHLHVQSHNIHQGLGIIINLSSLILIYLVTEKLIKKYTHYAKLT